VSSPRVFSPANLRRLRQEAGLTQFDVCFRAGWSGNRVSLMERGGVTPSAASLARVADALGCSVDDLFERVEVAS
jgi:transcriptional regulator with XRE-family HTH domain